MTRRRFLVDVDGVVCDLMGRDGHGFRRWLREQGVVFDPESLGNLRVTGDHRRDLLEFLAYPGSYLYYCSPIVGAVAAIRRIAEAAIDVRFVTSVTEEPRQVPAKQAWLDHHFQGIDFEVATIPSREKHYFMGDYMVDDRADTVYRFLQTDRRGVFLFSQPWNYVYGDEGGVWRDRKEFEEMARMLNLCREDQMREPEWDMSYTPFVRITDNWDAIADCVIEDAHG